jgi:hypothetical protein
MNAKHIALVGTGGSSGDTLALVEASIRAQEPASTFIFIDTQPFNLRTGGSTRYNGTGQVQVLSPENCGIQAYTGSQTTNLMLNGGPLAYRRLIARCAQAIGPKADVLVLCHDRMYVETALVRAAKARGIPTVLLQEGPFCAIGSTRAQSSVLRAKAALAPLINMSRLVPAIPDYGMAGHDLVIAVSETYRDRWINAGLDPRTVKVAGVPRFDQLYSSRPGGETRRPRPKAAQPLRLLYITQPFAAHGKVSHEAARTALNVMIAGLNLARRNISFDLIIRAHPRSTGDDVAHLRTGLEFSPTMDGGAASIDVEIGRADAVIGHYSTGLLESLMLGCPVICVPVPEHGFAERAEAEKQIWLTATGVPVARTSDELTTAIGLVARGEAMTEIDWPRLGEETGPTDGSACEVAARAILTAADFSWR